MKDKKDIAIRIARISIFVILAGIVGLYLGRNKVLNHLVSERIHRLEQLHGLRISYDQLELQGISEVSLQGLSVVPQGRDTLLTLRSADVKLRFWSLLARQVDVLYVRLNKLDVRFIKKDSIANYDFLFVKKDAEQPQESSPEKEYAQRTDRLLNLAFSFLPSNGELNHLQITEQKDRNFVSVLLPSLVIKENQFRADVEICEDTLSQQWVATGELNHSKRALKAELYAPGKHPVSLPYINRRFGAVVTFDTLSYSLTRQKTDEGIQLNGEARISGLNVFHKALSPETINLNQGQLTYQINIGSQFIELDSTTNVVFNSLSFHPYLRMENNSGTQRFTASVDKPWFPANELFSSLPKGLFGNLEGINTSGLLAYHFLLDVDFARLDSLVFESELQEKDFRILSYGATNLNKMSSEFVHTAYENGQPVRTFPVGPSWEHFTPLDSISPLLRMSVLQSEDGAFFYHRGFLPDAMREALIHDLKVRRFARGGSTISMQLVKNVFLTRKKNFARKLEEALIVWLIETEHLTSKERMYEVYLNIIEWGPLIYGIQEASEFYFKKRPSQLTAEESIFLASIVPKPKHFRNSFNKEGALKDNMEGYYRLITERLVKKGLIPETDSIRPNIEVTGEAKEIIGNRP